MFDLPGRVEVVEMLPRDGFQRLEAFVPTEAKIEIVDDLSTTGVDEIEFTSFAHPDAVPNLRDAEAVAAGIERVDGVTYRAQVPNVTGMERARDAGVDKVNALVTVSESYSRKNQRMRVDEAIAEVEGIVEIAHDADIAVEAGVATAFYCPYQGRIDPDRTLAVVESVVEAGVDEVTLAATMGLANPAQVADLFGRVRERWPDLDLGFHLHDTNGMSLANTLVAMACGVARFDAALCGLGGGVVLPEALTGVGNTPTEDLVHMLSGMDPGVSADFAAVTRTAERVADRLDLAPRSHVLMGGTVENVLATVERASEE
ncbi:MAG: hydroxymethylglutaryl-CoA lyase [Halobacteriales archaeon]